MTAPWLVRFAPRNDASIRLFAFSYAGAGAATYRPWLFTLPHSIDLCAVQLPGRESRLAEPPLLSLHAMIDGMLPAMRPYFDRPFAFFGHSMGALLAFELARTLHQRGESQLAHLLLSGRRAPHLPDPEAPMRQLDDDAFVAEIRRRYGGIPAEVLQHRDLMQMLLPGLRADMTAIETHEFRPSPPLSCPLTVFCGDIDHRALPEQLAQWQAYSKHPLQVRMFRGGHFYFSDASVRAELLNELAHLLEPLAAQRSGSAWR